MKRTLLHAALGAVFAASATMASLAVAAPPIMGVESAPFGPPMNAPGRNKLKCFDGPSEGTDLGGSCRIVGRGAMGPAILDLTADDPEGSYAGVYYEDSPIYGMALEDIMVLSYNYVATDDALNPGNLSLNIPIDTDGDGDTEAYAFIDAFYCPGTEGVVDVIEDEQCGIYYNGVDFYENWDAFVAAFPDAQIATDNFAFVLASRTTTDNAASYRVNAVKIGKPGR